MTDASTLYRMLIGGMPIGALAIRCFARFSSPGTRVAIKTIVKKRYTNAQSGSGNSNALKEVPSIIFSLTW